MIDKSLRQIQEAQEAQKPKTPKPKPQSVDEIYSSPFVQDTLLPLTGGPPTGGRVFGVPSFLKALAAKGTAIPGANAVVMEKTGDVSREGTLVHEMAHIADYRNVLPELEELLAPHADARINDIGDRPRHVYETGIRGLAGRVRDFPWPLISKGSRWRNRTEYFAGTFEQALRMIRNGLEYDDVDWEAGTGDWPGLRETISLLKEKLKALDTDE